MAFIISKKSIRDGKERELYYLVQNYREGKRIKRRTLLKLEEQNNLTELLERFKAEKQKLLNDVDTCKKQLEKLLLNENQPYFYYLKRKIPETIELKHRQITECQRKIDILQNVVPKTVYNN